MTITILAAFEALADEFDADAKEQHTEDLEQWGRRLAASARGYCAKRVRDTLAALRSSPVVDGVGEPVAWFYERLVHLSIADEDRWIPHLSFEKPGQKSDPLRKITPLYPRSALSPTSDRASVAKFEGPINEATRKMLAGFAEALAGKLRAAEDKYGYSDGWFKDNWEDQCRADLINHVRKGDPLDVAAYAAFCWARGWSTAADELDLWPALEGWLLERGLVERDGEYSTEDLIERLSDHEDQIIQQAESDRASVVEECAKVITDLADEWKRRGGLPSSEGEWPAYMAKAVRRLALSKEGDAS